METEIFNHARNPPGGENTELSSYGARMAWLQRPTARQTTSVSNHGNQSDSHLGESSAPMQLNDSEGKESHYPSSHSGASDCLQPYSDDQSTGISIGRIHYCEGVASTRAKYDKSARRRLELKR